MSDLVHMWQAIHRRFDGLLAGAPVMHVYIYQGGLNASTDLSKWMQHHHHNTRSTFPLFMVKCCELLQLLEEYSPPLFSGYEIK